jgi:metal-sulfur cluster biosynthetic enzyme
MPEEDMNETASLDVVVAETDSRAEGIRDALRAVIDPEIGLDVVTLGLIRAIDFDADGTQITMILTTPFCPYGGAMIQQVKMTAAEATGGEVRIVMGEEPWTPEMMEGGDWSEWGLV